MIGTCSALAKLLPAEDKLLPFSFRFRPTTKVTLVRRALNAVVSCALPRDRLQIQLLDDTSDATAEIAGDRLRSSAGGATMSLRSSARAAPASKPGRSRPAWLTPASRLSQCSTPIM